MDVNLLIKENKELREEKQRYKEMWFTANNSLAKYRKLEKQIGCPLEVFIKLKEYPHIYTDKGAISIRLVRDGLWWYAVYDSEYIDVQYPLTEYKKTWWLRKDKSE